MSWGTGASPSSERGDLSPNHGGALHAVRCGNTEKCFRIFKTGNIEDKIKSKEQKQQRRSGKKRKMNGNRMWTLSQLIQRLPQYLRKIKSIRGRPPSAINVLKENGTVFASIEEITEKLALSFQEIASGLNYDPQFLAYKETSEQAELNFVSNK